jgi:hypothetical protein
VGDELILNCRENRFEKKAIEPFWICVPLLMNEFQNHLFFKFKIQEKITEKQRDYVTKVIKENNLLSSSDLEVEELNEYM